MIAPYPHGLEMARAAIAEFKSTHERARRELQRSLEDRFVLPPGAEDDEAEDVFGVAVKHSGAGDDLRGILSDFDWIVERAWRRAKEALGS